MDLKLIDMKRSSPDEESGETAMPAGPDGEQYPYGLQINLCEDELAKLGIQQLPPVGIEVHGMFAGQITSASQDPGDDGDRRLTIQIMYLAMEAEKPHPGEGKETAKQESAENSKPGMFRSFGKPIIVE